MKPDIPLAMIVLATLAVAIGIALATAWVVDSYAAVTPQGVFVGLAGAAVLVAGFGGVTAVVSWLAPTSTPEERLLGE